MFEDDDSTNRNLQVTACAKTLRRGKFWSFRPAMILQEATSRKAGYHLNWERFLFPVRLGICYVF